jgi:tRNA(fMet)-specific endonuclease VapC
MARFLLDTNLCIHIAKRRPLEVMARFERLQAGEAALSVITYGELRLGAEKSASRGLSRWNGWNA